MRCSPIAASVAARWASVRPKGSSSRPCATASRSIVGSRVIKAGSWFAVAGTSRQGPASFTKVGSIVQVFADKALAARALDEDVDVVEHAFTHPIDQGV